MNAIMAHDDYKAYLEASEYAALINREIIRRRDEK
jgi:hypothetical protein